MKFHSNTHNRKIYKDKTIGRQIERSAIATLQWVWVIGLAIVLAVFSYIVTKREFLIPILSAVAFMMIASVLLGFFLWFGQNWYARGAKRWRKGLLASVFCYSFAVGASLSALTWSHPVSLIPAVLWMLGVAYNLVLIYRLAPFLHTTQLSISASLAPIIISNICLGSVLHLIAGVLLTVAGIGLMRVSTWSNQLFWDKHQAEYLLKQKLDSKKISERQTSTEDNINTGFVKNLAQELKQGVNEIVGCIALLKDSDPNAQQSELIEFIEQASDRQSALINDASDFASIREHRITLEHNPFNLYRCVEDAIVTCAREAELQHVEVNAIIDAAMPYRAKGDAKRIRQIVRALLSSVLRSSQHGHVFVRVDCQESSSDKGVLEVQVIDRGAQGKLTGAVFNQCENSSARFRVGAGLELMICQNLAECMNGELGGSDTTEGHCYWLKIPLEINSNQRHFFSPNNKLRGRQVCVVNAPEEIQQNFSEELAEWGISTHFCKTEADITQHIRDGFRANQKIEGVIIFANNQHHTSTDSSWLLLNELSGRLEHKNIAFIIVASHRMAKIYSEQVGLLNRGNIGVTEKPIQFRQLHQELVQHMLKIDLTKNIEPEENLIAAGNQKILLVEDHQVNLMVAEGMLRKLGYEPELAHNGIEALALLEQSHFDLVLMDCQMAEMDGYTATRKIRDLEKQQNDLSHIPIIALTAHTADEDQTRCFDAGMDDYLAKPVRYSDLEGRLRRWLKHEPPSLHH